MKAKWTLAAAVLTLLQCSFTFSAELKIETELGYQSAASVSQASFSRSLFYGQPSLRLTHGEFEARLSTRAWVDTRLKSNENSANQWIPMAPPKDWERDFSIRALNFTYSYEALRITAGFQEIPWGETFGFPILDVVNPRDYSDPILLDSSWIRLPVPAMQLQSFLGRWTLQAIFTPFPRNAYFPSSAISDLPTREGGSDVKMEYGGRASYLFENGFDIGLSYFQHRNRIPVYGLSPSLELFPIQSRVHTLGGTVSQAIGQWVIRLDTALHLDQPIQGSDLSQMSTVNQWQTVLGSDLTTEDDWSIGVQFQTEADYSQNTNKFLKWISAKVSKKLLRGKLISEVFAFSGIANSDLWIQPQLTYLMSDSWTMSLRGDWIFHSRNQDDGYFRMLGNQNRFLLWLTFRS